MLRLHDCKTADEVLEHYKRVRARTNQWKAPQPVPAPIPEPPPVIKIPIIVMPAMTAIPVHISEAEPVIRHPSIHRIVGAVCQKYDIPRNDLISTRRTAPIVRARHIAMYLAKTLTLKSYPEIGRHIGDKDHTTVLAAVRKVTRLRAAFVDLNNDLAELESILGGKDV